MSWIGSDPKDAGERPDVETGRDGHPEGPVFRERGPEADAELVTEEGVLPEH